MPMKRSTIAGMLLVAACVVMTGLLMLVYIVHPGWLLNDFAKPQVSAATAAIDAGDYGDARKILKPLAQKGNADAQLWLGYMDEHGLGTRKNFDAALALYNKAAQSGAVLAERRLGQIYFYGNGVLQDVASARQWLLQAAERDDPVAQRLLGEIYAKGLGVAKDPAQAYAWLDIAASRGDAVAAHERDALLPLLSPAELDHAQMLATDAMASIARPQPPSAPAAS